MTKKFKHLIIGCCLLLSIYIVTSQSPGSHVYFTADGFLYLWDLDKTEPQQLTHDGYIHRLVQSPDDRRIAFVWHHLDEDRSNFTSYGYAYADSFKGDTLHILQDGSMSAITGDSTTSRIPPYQHFSRPTWSVNGQQLAWTLGTMATDENTGYTFVTDTRLRYYDFDTNRILGDDQFADGIYMTGGDAGESSLASPIWLTHYIGILSYGVRSVTLNLQQPLASQNQRSLYLGDYIYTGGGIGVVDVTTEKGQYIGVFFSQYNQWDLVNPYTFQSDALNNARIERYSPNATDMSLYWQYDVISQSWQPIDNTQNILASVPSELKTVSIALSPDGQEAAYIADDRLHIVYENGNTQSLSYDGLHSLAWGPMQWRIIQNNVETDTIGDNYFDETNCPPTLFSVGTRSMLSNPYNYNELYAHINPLRYIYQIFPSDIPITILDGPRCPKAVSSEVATSIWWQIEVYDLIGWVSEENLIGLDQ